jgi:transposase, IS6 family
MRTRRVRPNPVARSAFAGFCFPPDVIVLAVRWYLRFGLSYRDVEELLAERGIEVDHVSVYRWVQRFTPLLAEAARPCRHAVGHRWWGDETYVKVTGRWRYIYRAIDQSGQVIDVFVSPRRDGTAARRFFERAISTTKTMPNEVVTDLAPTYPVVVEELLPTATTDARAQAGAQPPGRNRRIRHCPERSPRALRAGSRGTGEAAIGSRLRRARPGDLTPSPRHDFSMREPTRRNPAGKPLPCAGSGLGTSLEPRFQPSRTVRPLAGRPSRCRAEALTA